MELNESKHSPDKDTISFNELLAVGRELKHLLVGSLSFVFTAVKKTYWIILLSAIVGAGLAYYNYKSQTLLYASTMMMYNTELSRKHYGELLNQLDKLTQSKNYKALAKELDMPEAEVKKLANFYATNDNDQVLNYDNGKTPGFFKLTCGTSDPSIYDTLQYKVIAYLNNNPFNKSRNKLVIEKLNSKISYYDDEIAKLDSIKMGILAYLKAGNISASVLEKANPVEISKRQEELIEKKEDAVSYLSIYTPVEMVYGFKMQSAPTQQPLTRYLKKWGVVCFGAGLLLSLFIEFFRRV